MYTRIKWTINILYNRRDEIINELFDNDELKKRIYEKYLQNISDDIFRKEVVEVYSYAAYKKVGSVGWIRLDKRKCNIIDKESCRIEIIIMWKY